MLKTKGSEDHKAITSQGLKDRLSHLFCPFNSLVFLAACLVFLLGCPSERPSGEKTSAFEKVSSKDLPSFEDDLDPGSLRQAVERSLIFCDRVPEDRTYPLGDRRITTKQLKASLTYFLELLNKKQLTREAIAEGFDVYRAPQTDDGKGNALITGYYEPILDGRLKPDKEYNYPIYGLPPDMVIIEPAKFDSERFPDSSRLVGRLEGNQIVPYYTRAEIDGKKKLKSARCEIAWLNDPIKGFFMHVQGSGTIRLEDGRILRLGYAGTNGRPYRSVGKYMIEKGIMPSDAVSLQSIEIYLREHPEKMEEILWHNESYVFFRSVYEGPLGSIGVVLTPGRSIAVDPECYPKGGLAFLETQKPVLDSTGNVVGWEPLRRWVLDQDAGGAIKGPGRADLFVGSGAGAEWIAGRLKHPGTLYFFVKKESAH